MVGQAGLAVVPRGAVLAQADAAALGVLGVTGDISSGKYLLICKKKNIYIFVVPWDADVGVAVTLAPAAHDEVGDGVVVGLQHLRVTEHLVTECIQIAQRNP